MYNPSRNQSQKIIARPAGESDEGSDDTDDDFEVFDMPGFRNKKVNVNNHQQQNGSTNGIVNNGHHGAAPPTAAQEEDDWGETSGTNDTNRPNTSSTSRNEASSSNWLRLTPIEEVRLACTRGDLERLKLALERGEISVNHMFDDGYTPLIEAAAHGNFDIVKYLVVEKHADPDVFHYNTKIAAVMTAAACHYPDKHNAVVPCLRILIEEGGADVNKQDKYGLSPLIIAVKRQRLDVVKYLLEEARADPNIADNSGRTALFHAADVGDGRMCRMLLENKADIYVVDDGGWTAPELANDKGHYSLAELLYIVRDTKWSPGLNPKLIQEIDETVIDRMKERTRDGFSIKEDSQLELLLTSLNAEKYIELFRKHKVSYVQFLVLEEEHLKEMGVDDVGIRVKLVEAIRETHNTRWGTTSLNMVPINKTITAAEAICMVENIKTHLDHISATIRSLKNRISKDPKSLRLGKEVNKIQDLISFIIQMRDGNEVLRKDTHNLLKLFLEIQDFVEFKIGDEVTEPKSIEEFIKLWKKKKMATTKSRSKASSKTQTLSVTKWKGVTFGFGCFTIVGAVSAFFLWKNVRAK